MSQLQKTTNARRARQARRRRLRNRDRRGVLLLVVLSMLVLFLLIGTTFVITAKSASNSLRINEVAHETSLQAEDRLERALLQVLRDTNNPHSAIRYHSLLRDVYGTDGFVGHVYAGQTERQNINGSSSGNASVSLTTPNTLSGGFAGPGTHTSGLDAADYASRYSDATSANPLGPTNGQLIDIFIEDDMQSSVASGAVSSDAVGLRPEYVVNLELNEDGLTTNHTLSRTSGYYNGCLLTVLEGPAKGQTTRIVQYDFFASNNVATDNPARTGIARFRVLAFSRNDGSPLQLNVNPRNGGDNDLVYANDTGNPLGTINDNDPFFGVRVMVNGRANNGTGVGLNQRAAINGPKLSTLELIGAVNGVDAEFAHVALLPNAAYHGMGAFYSRQFNPGDSNDASLAALNYGVYPGAGGSDESYDAADFQNMFLALQSPTPRPEARVVDNAGTTGTISAYYSGGTPDAPSRLNLDGVPIPSFHRPALVNYWLHRLFSAPWLVNAVPDEAQRIRAILQPYGADGRPGGGDDNIGNPAVAAQIVAIKRKISLRPLHEDHPNFNGSNPQSNLEDGRALAKFNQIQHFVNGTQISFPYWEVAGPWDVDNDNDGVPDSIWVDLGDPVQKTADGRLYKPLYAILIEDLDGRLNINVHGSDEHLAGADLDPSSDNGGATNFNLVSGASSILGISGSSLLSTNQLPHGSGWGAGEISLRSVMSPDLVTSSPGLIGQPAYDDYARLFYGRVVPNAFTPATGSAVAAIATESKFGRYGSVELWQSQGFTSLPGAGVNFVDGEVADATVADARNTIDRLASYELYDYPQFDDTRVRRGTNAVAVDPLRVDTVNVYSGGQPNSYGHMHDLPGRYAIPGLTYGGQPYAESASDADVPTLVADSTYEVQSMDDARRGEPQAFSAFQNDDALFSPAEIERILRANDADAGSLPSRLWDVVNAFDPSKLVVELNNADVYANANYVASSAQMVSAQLESSTRRRSVTTDSLEIPSPSESWTPRLVYGADGRPGAAGVDEDNANDFDDAGEFNIFNGSLIDGVDAGIADGLINTTAEIDAARAAFANGNDDYFVVMGADPPANARLIDYLRYRVLLELKRRGITLTTGVSIVEVMPDVDRAAVIAGSYPFSLDDVNEVESRINAVIYGNNAAVATTVRVSGTGPIFASYGGLIAPEVVAGLKMDLNRPFGDGKDNNGNGVVDEPSEAGEPWIDVNGNGRWDNEPYQDLDGDGRFYADVDGDGVFVLGDGSIGLGDGSVDPGDLADLDGDTIGEPAVDILYTDHLGYPIAFDHTAGVDASGRGAFTPSGYRVHDDGPMARQLYARHLYCLMLALMDENYLAPFDEQDPQVRNYIDPDSEAATRTGNGDLVRQKSMAMRIKESLVANGMDATTASAEARRQALRKLTCRKIAQWAINCADMRDPDAIMTPFEYDENPWDGWNVVDPENGQVYPIDGDLSTNENAGDYILVEDGGWTPVDNDEVPAPNQTCGVVWGLERPEMIMTEGLALHDRRVEDLPGAGDEGDVGDNDREGNPITDPTGLEMNDDDLDQRLRPRGAAFIELFNPWDESGPRPAELYRTSAGGFRGADLNKDGTDDIAVEGVILDRLSNAVAIPLDENGDRRTDRNGAVLPAVASPVWRMVCIEEHPDMRNDDPYDAPLGDGASAYPERSTTSALSRPSYTQSGFNRWPAGVLSATDRDDLLNNFDQNQLPLTWHTAGTASFVDSWRRDARKEVTAPLRMTNPDFPTFDSYASPQLLRSTGPGKRVVYAKPKAYIEREWYFTRGIEADAFGTRGATDLRVDPADVPLCIPVRPLVLSNGADIIPETTNAERLQMWPDNIKARTPPGATTARDLAVYPWRFPPIVQDNGDYRSLRLAPVLPGRYAVAGSAGTEYGTGNGALPQFEGRYVTTLGRTMSDIDNATPHAFTQGSSGNRIETEVTLSRRIELVPNTNPFLHQVAVAMNGGDECRLLQPGPNNAYVFNATDPSSFPTDYNSPRTTRTAANLKSFNDQTTDPASGLKPFYTDLNNNATNDFEIDPSNSNQSRYYAIKPAVAAPIVGMNISEPLDSYFFRKAELDELMDPNQDEIALDWDKNAEAGEGRFEPPTDDSDITAYDEPFDIQPELIINHTTPNYRSVHLQRLANPLLAWNPPPLRPDGSAHPQHDANRPVNPYCTIDSMSLDLTAFNSINDHETRMQATGFRIDELRRVFENGQPAETLHKKAHFLPEHGVPLSGYNPGSGDADKVLMTLSSQYRGFHDQILTYGDATNSATAPDLNQTVAPGRALWSQEKPNQIIDILDDRIDIFDTRPQSINPDGAVRVHEDLSPRGPGIGGLAMNFPIRHTLGYDNLATRRRIENKPNGATGAAKDFYPSKVELRGIFTSDRLENYEGINSLYGVDINGDGILGDLVGVPRVNEANLFASDNPKTDDDDPTTTDDVETGKPDYRDDATNPWLTWNDRPYLSGMEILLTPASSSARLMTDYSFINPFESDPASRYDGYSEPLPDGNAVGAIADNGAGETNVARLAADNYPYGHLLNVFQASSSPAITVQVNDQAIPVGAANFHRIADYVYTPSRFVGTDLFMDPTVFNTGSVASPFDARQGFLAPFNKFAKYREPGKVNLNTIVGTRDFNEASDMWSDVYDGLMHRIEDGNFIDYSDPANPALIAAGHLGPAWRDVVLSRRGYSVKIGRRSPVQDYSQSTLHPDYPSRFANPFRSAAAGDLVPITALQRFGVDASMLRAHPYSPGENGVWGADGDDAMVDKTGDGFADRDLIADNASEAGAGDDLLLARGDDALPDSQKESVATGAVAPVEPLFGELTTEPALDGGRNPGVAYNPMTRLDNLTTTRSGVFAVWITVGFFEVTPAPEFASVAGQFSNSLELYNRVYPDGYQLGKEIGSDTGDTKRFRGFWIIDRTRPVAFKPGENVNSEQAILLQRRIE